MASIPLPIDSFPPTRFVWVSPDGQDSNSGTAAAPKRTIGAALTLATPGTAVMVKTGMYTECVKFRQSGTTAAPIRLVSADGPGTATLRPSVEGLPTVSGYGVDHIVVQDFNIVGQSGSRTIEFTQKGNNFTDLATNIYIIGNTISQSWGAGIRVAQADRIYVVDNVVNGTDDGEGIDFLAVTNSVIAGNLIRDVNGGSGIQVKGGSTNVDIKGNEITRVYTEGDGISVGQATEEVYMRPGYDIYEAQNIKVTQNIIHDVSRRAVQFMGAVNSTMSGNRIYNITNSQVVNLAASIATHAVPINTMNTTIFGNMFDRTDFLSIDPGQGTGVIEWQNRTDGILTPPSGRGLATAGPDLLFGSKGNDIINGLGGADTMSGGSGNDTYYVNSTADRIVEQMLQGSDTVYASANYTLPPSVEALLLTGPVGLVGVGNGLTNSLTGTQWADGLDGAHGDDTIRGGNGDDKILGGSGNDQLLGQQGNDKINGGEGNDVLIGGGGSNNLTGGAGSDAFVFDATQGSQDLINDFVPGTDILEIRNAGTGFEALRVTAHKTGDALIYFGASNVVLLKGIAPPQVDADWFHFIG
jgi:serralysin